jgi:capsular polysaccharide biosynthesis protein
VSNPSPSEDRATPPGTAAEPEPIDLLGYLKGLGRHWLAGLIAAIIVAGAFFGLGAVAGSGSQSVGSTWARAHVMMTLPAPANQGQAVMLSEAASRTINSYLAVQDSDPLLRHTAARLNDGTTVSVLKAATSMYWGGGGQVIAFYALGTDEKQAEQRANAYARAFIQDSSGLLPPAVAGTPVPTFTLVQAAFPSPANPDPLAAAGGSSTSKLLGSPVVDVVAGIVVGLLVMAGLELRSSRRRLTA